MPLPAMVLPAMNIMALNGKPMQQSRSWRLNWNESGRQCRFQEGGRHPGGWKNYPGRCWVQKGPAKIAQFFGVGTRSSSLSWVYDEPETLRYSTRQFSPIGADAGHACAEQPILAEIDNAAAQRGGLTCQGAQLCASEVGSKGDGSGHGEAPMLTSLNQISLALRNSLSELQLQGLSIRYSYSAVMPELVRVTRRITQTSRPRISTRRPFSRTARKSYIPDLAARKFLLPPGARTPLPNSSRE